MVELRLVGSQEDVEAVLAALVQAPGVTVAAKPPRSRRDQRGVGLYGDVTVREREAGLTAAAISAYDREVLRCRDSGDLAGMSLHLRDLSQMWAAAAAAMNDPLARLACTRLAAAETLRADDIDDQVTAALSVTAADAAAVRA